MVKVGKEHKIAENTSKGRLTAKLTYQHGVPVRAEVTGKTPAGFQWPRIVLKYKYDPGFHDGRFPVEITRYQGPPGRDDLRLDFTLKISELETSTNPLASEEFDPKVALAGSYRFTTVHSNGVAYDLRNDGSLVKIVSVADVDAGGPRAGRGPRAAAMGHMPPIAPRVGSVSRFATKSAQSKSMLILWGG